MGSQARQTAALLSDWHPQDGARGKFNENRLVAPYSGDSHDCNGLQPRTLSRLDNTVKLHHDGQLVDGLHALNPPRVDERFMQCGDAQTVNGLQPKTLSSEEKTTMPCHDEHGNGELQP